MPPFKPVIVVFACHYCAYTAADMAGAMHQEYPDNVKIIKVPCTGKVDVQHIMRAMEKGADGVLVAGCLEGDCHFKDGNLLAKKRVAYVKTLLEDIGIGGDRVEMAMMSAGQGAVFAHVAQEFTDKIRALGANPIKDRAGQAAA